MHNNSRNSVDTKLLQVWTTDQMRTVLAFSAASFQSTFSALPFVRQARRRPTAVAVEAGVRRRTVRDIDGIGDVDDVEGCAPVLPFVMDGGVAEHNGGHCHRVEIVGKRAADIAYAAAETEPGQRAALEGVVGPARDERLGRVGRGLADQR